MTQQKPLMWIDEAFKHLGVAEIKGSATNPTILNWLKEAHAPWSDDETAWCGLFVHHCLLKADIKTPSTWYRALSYSTLGTLLAKPAFGCVAIKKRVGGGHVTFVVGKDEKTGKLVCLGGNQGDKVSLALYDANAFVEFRWYGKTPRPAIERYDLPVYNGTIISNNVKED